MLGKSRMYIKSGRPAKMLAALLILGLISVQAMGQVMIVPSNKLRTTKSSGKSKSKSKSKSNVNTASENSPNSSPDPISSSASFLQPLAFVVVPPSFKSEVRTDFGLLGGKPASFNLQGYDFDVITADVRGKVIDSRRESARCYSEDLSAGVKIEMVEISTGAFMMGSVDTNMEEMRREYVHGVEREMRESLIRRLNWEMPQHMVKVPAFYMSKFEVTQAQWRAVASLPKVYRELVSDPSQFKGSNRPVENVSWEDAVEFCERLSRAVGRRYRLPTEAEWEYSARAGTTSQFAFGDSVTPDWANFHGRQSFGFSPRGAFRQQTVPVGSLGIANAFGLYDMHGNVWEWCLDTWHDDYQSAPADGGTWESGGIAYLKTLRGGGWDSTAGECRSGSRNKMTSTIRLNNIGFRVVAEIATATQLANK